MNWNLIDELDTVWLRRYDGLIARGLHLLVIMAFYISIDGISGLAQQLQSARFSIFRVFISMCFYFVEA